MISGRTFMITSIIIVVLSVGLFFYTQQRNWKFAQELPTLPPKHTAVELSASDKTPTDGGSRNPNSAPASAGPLEVETTGVDTPASEIQRNTDTAKKQRSTEEAKFLSQAEIDTFFDDPSLFRAIDLQTTPATLEEMLREMHGDDPRVSTFLRSWDTTAASWT